MKTFLAIVLVAAAGPSIAQEPVTTIKSKSELVLVPVVVERDGQPVTGLKPTDFLLLHQGEPTSIAVFEEISGAEAPTARATDPQVVTNFGVGTEQSDTFIVLLDFLNSTWQSGAYMREYFRDMMKVFADSKTRVTVLLLTPKGLVQAQSFTTDPTELYKAVDTWSKKKELPQTEEMQTVPPEYNFASAYAVSNMNGTIDIFDRLAYSPKFHPQIALDRAAMTTRALEQISEAFGGIPGRKKLAWVSTGFPHVQDIVGDRVSPLLEFEVRDLIVRAWHALSTKNIVVYPIDSNGGPTVPGFQPPPNTMSMLEVAARTGGSACVDTLKDCMGKALHADKHYYLLGFYLKGEQKPGWHKVKVELTGPSAHLHARTGFVVADDKPKDKELEKRSEREIVTAAMASPLDYTGIPLTMHWVDATGKDKSRQLQIEIASPAGTIQANAGNLDLDFLAFVRPVGKTDGQGYPVSLRTAITPLQQEALMKRGFGYRKQIPISAGTFQLKVFLRDNTTGNIGTVSSVITLK